MTLESTPERRTQTITEICVEQGKQQERLRNLEEWQKMQNGTLSKILNKLEDLTDKIHGRPSWSVTILITLLSSACVGLLVAVVMLAQ